MKCPICDMVLSTFRHPNAKVRCSKCGFVFREEGVPVFKSESLGIPYINKKILIVGAGVNSLNHSTLLDAVQIAKGDKGKYDIDMMLEKSDLVLIEPVGGCNNYFEFMKCLLTYMIDAIILSPEHRVDAKTLNWSMITTRSNNG